MSVYYKESPKNLIRSVESVMNQTIPPSDFVIVCDGPLTEELDLALSSLQQTYTCINLLRLKKNQGLGIALENGLLVTKYDIVMRMDSDDVCIPTRAEVQLPLLEKYDLVGSNISEFENDETNIIGRRIVPQNYKEILKFAKKRSPFNHPSVTFKKDIILKVGNYKSLLYVEDYFLWVRILLETENVFNVQDILVKMRSGKVMRARRGGWIYIKSLTKLRKFMLKRKMINFFEFLYLVLIQNLFLSLPTSIRESLYNLFLREKGQNS